MPHDELIERLLATRSIQHTVSARDDDDPVPRVPINPDGPEAAEALTTMQARLDRVRSIVENGYPNQPAKVDQCKHGRFGYEDCIACYDEALLEALGISGLVER
jgi:hypothetical protein